MKLAHIQRGAKQDTVPNTGLMLAQCHRRWANISTALGQCLVFAGETPLRRCLNDRNRWTDWTDSDRHTEQTEVNQHVPTSVYRGGDITILL